MSISGPLSAKASNIFINAVILISNYCTTNEIVRLASINKHWYTTIRNNFTKFSTVPRYIEFNAKKIQDQRLKKLSLMPMLITGLTMGSSMITLNQADIELIRIFRKLSYLQCRTLAGVILPDIPNLKCLVIRIESDSEELVQGTLHSISKFSNTLDDLTVDVSTGIVTNLSFLEFIPKLKNLNLRIILKEPPNCDFFNKMSHLQSLVLTDFDLVNDIVGMPFIEAPDTAIINNNNIPELEPLPSTNIVNKFSIQNIKVGNYTLGFDNNKELRSLYLKTNIGNILYCMADFWIELNIFKINPSLKCFKLESNGFSVLYANKSILIRDYLSNYCELEHVTLTNFHILDIEFMSLPNIKSVTLDKCLISNKLLNKMKCDHDAVVEFSSLL